MNEAAEHHVTQSRYTEAGEEEKFFEFEDMSYWLFPVELRAVLRLREREGIAAPPIELPALFRNAIGQTSA